MSHFTVLVIGDNPEEQLAPYDENLEVEEYADKDGELTTYNPKSRWDWYLLGGRWRGYFKVREGVESLAIVGEPGVGDNEAKPGWADQLRKGEVDFDSMTKEDAEIAAKTYDVVTSLLRGTPTNKTFDEVLNETKEGSSKGDEARKIYWNQPRCKKWKEAEDSKVIRSLGFMASPDEFLCTREEYIKEAEDSAISTFAVVKDGEWYEKGEMGW